MINIKDNKDQRKIGKLRRNCHLALCLIASPNAHFPRECLPPFVLFLFAVRCPPVGTPARLKNIDTPPSGSPCGKLLSLLDV